MQVLYVYTMLQIIFESLPVSSSGNVLLWMPLLQNALHLTPPENSIPDFDFLLHVPTLIIIAVFFFSLWITYVQRISVSFYTIVQRGLVCGIGDGMTVLFYFLWKRIGVAEFPLWVGFFITTVLLLSLRFCTVSITKWHLTLRDALGIGIVQGLALLPGISRLASTFVTAVWLGYSYEKAFSYSFLLQVPLMGAAFVQGLWSLAHAPSYAPFDEPVFYALILGATAISFCVLKIVFGMVKRKTIWMFAGYTACTTVLAWFLG